MSNRWMGGPRVKAIEERLYATQTAEAEAGDPREESIIDERGQARIKRVRIYASALARVHANSRVRFYCSLAS